MSHHRVVFLGGNGHCAARLAAARRILTGDGVELSEVHYPGFEGRPRAPDLDSFLRAIADELAQDGGRQPRLAYATGIGGLIALCLRARRVLRQVPLLLQAPVLWGLEHRFMPRVMRMRAAQAMVGRLFAARAFQRRFVKRHFQCPPPPEMQAAFFAGYAQCAALPDLFAWFTPDLLAQLGGQLAGAPGSLERISVWWGGHDRVVTLRELRWTEQALCTRWPVTVFPGWGHYPMIDEPETWARALRESAAQHAGGDTAPPRGA